jgi:hypothetical protein
VPPCALVRVLVVGPEAPRTDLDGVLSPLDKQVGPVYIGKPAPPRMTLGVADLIAVLWSLTTDIALHVIYPCFTFVLTMATM